MNADGRHFTSGSGQNRGFRDVWYQRYLRLSLRSERSCSNLVSHRERGTDCKGREEQCGIFPAQGWLPGTHSTTHINPRFCPEFCGKWLEIPKRRDARIVCSTSVKKPQWDLQRCWLCSVTL